ncbi:MAG: hypothetical protein WDZ49_16145 [Litorilinea sp.]
MELQQHPRGNYHFLTGIAPYSSAVIADPGYTLARFEFPQPVPYQTGFARIAALLEQLGRPRQALCAVELRIPEPLPFQGFIDFNQEYCTTLQEWDIYVDGVNPVARTNVAPGIEGVYTASTHAFTLTLPTAQHLPLAGVVRPVTFVVAGAGDLRDQADLSTAAIVRPNDTSPDAMRVKAETVLDVMEARLAGIGCHWNQVAQANVYTVEPLDSIMQSHLLPRLGTAAIQGVNWYYSRPPIAGLAYEMDLRSVGMELRIE